MALDRFVYWQDEVPSEAQIKSTLIFFLGGLGEVKDGDDRIYVTLPGKASHVGLMSARPGASPLQEPRSQQDKNTFPEERWFEVYIAEDHIDVITRLADELTNAIAASFASLAARLWNGKINDGS